MIIEINDKGFLDREIIIKLPKEKIKSVKEKKIIDLSKSLNLKGFRKGFVPHNVIISRFEKEIDNEVLNDLLYNNLIDFIKNNNINFVKFPVLKKSDTNPFQDYLLFIFELEVYPFIDINFDKIKVIKYNAIITDSDVICEIDRLRKIHGYWENFDNVCFGDKISFDIFNKSNMVSVYSDKDIIVDEKYTSLLGFSNFISGKKRGCDYIISFFNNTIEESFNGNFIFRIHDIKRFFIAQLDSLFYNKVGFSGTYDFKIFIKSNLNVIKSDLEDVLLKNEFLSSLLSNHDFPLPNLILNDKFDYFKSKGIVKEKDSIIREVKLDLILKELVKKFNIYVSKDEVLRFFNNKNSTLTEIDDNYYKNIENEIYIEKIKEVLLTKIYLEEKDISFRELLFIGNYV
ncbi:MAG TPA: trigger factor [Candidatus Azoamicus sp.]